MPPVPGPSTYDERQIVAVAVHRVRVGPNRNSVWRQPWPCVSSSAVATIPEVAHPHGLPPSQTCLQGYPGTLKGEDEDGYYDVAVVLLDQAPSSSRTPLKLTPAGELVEDGMCNAHCACICESGHPASSMAPGGTSWRQCC